MQQKVTEFENGKRKMFCKASTIIVLNLPILFIVFLLQGGAQISLADYDIQNPVRFRWYNLLSCAVSLDFNS